MPLKCMCMRQLSLLILLLSSSLFTYGRDRVAAELTIQPATKTFSARYTLSTRVTGGQLLLNLRKPYHLAQVMGLRVKAFTSRLVYDAFTDDTLQQVTVTFRDQQPNQCVTLHYSGPIAPQFATDSMAEFTAHASWVPTIPNREYEVVQYRLTVQVPAEYQVVSTREGRTRAPGRHEFRGNTSTIEIGALAARRFTLLTSGTTPGAAVKLYKANRPATATDSLLVKEAGTIIQYFNQIIGRQDPIRRFTFLLPGVDRAASGLLDNAAIIAYTTFNTHDPGDRLILAHEISHKWWGYGTWNTYDNWLNEAFATYSGLLYLRAAGDTASFRRELGKRQQSAATAPAIWGFEPRNHPYPVRRQVLYDKGTVLLYDLHQQLGDERFFRLLSATAAARVATTAAFLRVVERESSPAIREWVRARLQA